MCPFVGMVYHDAVHVNRDAGRAERDPKADYDPDDPSGEARSTPTAGRFARPPLSQAGNGYASARARRAAPPTDVVTASSSNPGGAPRAAAEHGTASVKGAALARCTVITLFLIQLYILHFIHNRTRGCKCARCKISRRNITVPVVLARRHAGPLCKKRGVWANSAAPHPSASSSPPSSPPSSACPDPPFSCPAKPAKSAIPPLPPRRATCFSVRSSAATTSSLSAPHQRS